MADETRIYGPYKHGDIWRIHEVTRSGGRRKTSYRTFATQDLADAWLSGASDQAQGITVKESVDMFLAWKRDEMGCAQTTLENYTFRLHRLLNLEANGTRALSWVKSRGAELYRASVYGAGDTHINGLSVGRMWGCFLIETKLAKTNPFAGVKSIGKRRRGAHKPRFTVNDSRKLEGYCFAHPDDPYCVLTYGYMMLGKRASELIDITPRDLDDDGWLLRIGKAKTEASLGSIPVGVELRDMLLAIARGKTLDSPLFTNLGGGKLTRHTAYARVRAVFAAADVPVLSPQALRRTFIDNASRQGFALQAISRQAGHTSTAVTTRSYMSPEQVQAAAMERNSKVFSSRGNNLETASEPASDD